MKRLVIGAISCFVLSIMLIFSGCSSGGSSGFSLRNDIHFGDSVKKVKSKESLGIKHESKDKDDSTVSYLTSENGTIANIPDSYVMYSFKNDSLYKMSYTLGSRTTEGDSSREVSELISYVNDQYDDLNKALTEKYGDPLSSDEREKYDSVTEFNKHISNFELLAALGADSEIIGAEEWLAEGDDGSHVVITLKTEYVGGESYLGYSMAEYWLIPEDKWNTILENQKNIDADL